MTCIVHGSVDVIYRPPWRVCYREPSVVVFYRPPWRVCYREPSVDVFYRPPWRVCYREPSVDVFYRPPWRVCYREPSVDVIYRPPWRVCYREPSVVVFYRPPWRVCYREPSVASHTICSPANLSRSSDQRGRSSCLKPSFIASQCKCCFVYSILIDLVGFVMLWNYRFGVVHPCWVKIGWFMFESWVTSYFIWLTTVGCNGVMS